MAMSPLEERLTIDLVKKQKEVIESQAEVIELQKKEIESLKNGDSFSQSDEETEGKSAADLYNESMGRK